MVITNSMELGPSWEANSSSATQKTPTILLAQKSYYFVHKNPQLAFTLIQTNAVQIPFYLFKIYFNIILSSMCRSSKWSLSFRVVPHTCYMPSQSHLPSFDRYNIWHEVQILKLLVIQVYSASCYFFYLRSRYSPKHPLLKYPVYIIPLILEGQLAHEYKITGTIIVLCTLICTFSDNKHFYCKAQNDNY
jgi:hypothetical protein